MLKNRRLFIRFLSKSTIKQKMDRQQEKHCPFSCQTASKAQRIFLLSAIFYVDTHLESKRTFFVCNTSSFKY